MPLAPVIVSGQAEDPSNGRPHAIGGDHSGGPDPAHPVNGHRRSGVVDVDPSDSVAFGDFGARCSGQAQEGSVVRAAGYHRGVAAVVAGEREADRPSRRRVEHCTFHWLPVANGGRVQPQLLAESEGQGGQAVTAALVTGESRLVHQQHRPASPCRGDGCRAASRATAYHQDVYRPDRVAHPQNSFRSLDSMPRRSS